MAVLLIVLLIFALIDCIEIEVNLENTFWLEKNTNRRIKVISCNNEKGILFQYIGESGLKSCSLATLLKEFKYDGKE